MAACCSNSTASAVALRTGVVVVVVVVVVVIIVVVLAADVISAAAARATDRFLAATLSSAARLALATARCRYCTVPHRHSRPHTSSAVMVQRQRHAHCQKRASGHSQPMSLLTSPLPVVLLGYAPSSLEIRENSSSLLEIRENSSSLLEMRENTSIEVLFSSALPLDALNDHDDEDDDHDDDDRLP